MSTINNCSTSARWIGDDEIANEARGAELAIIISHPTRVSGIIDLLKNNNQEILLDLADFASQEQPEDYLWGMV